MGCGASKEIERQIVDYQQKIDEIQEVNGQLVLQIQELRDLKIKRKPIYVVSDQEIDDLYVFKTELDKRFEKIDSDFEKIKNQLQGENPNNMKELDMMEDIEMTIKPFPDPIFDQSEDLSQKSKKQQTQTIVDLNDQKIQSIDSINGNNDLKKTVPKSEKNMSNQSELSKQLAEVIGDEMKEINEGLKSKLFYNTTTNAVIEEPVVKNQTKNSTNKQKIENQSQVNIKETPKIKTDVIKRKSVRTNSSSDKSNFTQQHFYSKQPTGGAKGKSNVRKKQIEQYGQ